VKQHPKNLKQQQVNIRKLYKHQYNTQNKQYKTYKEQIINQTPKDQVKEKLEQIKEEQNRKFSLLYEHYKTNVEAVYQQQNLKLNGTQQLEQDNLNEDLEKQMRLLFLSHTQRKHQQTETFQRENEHLDLERRQKLKDLETKMEKENEEFERSSQQRLKKLKEIQNLTLEKFDNECLEKFSILIHNISNTNTNRYSVYNLDSFRNSLNSKKNNDNFNNSEYLSYNDLNTVPKANIETNFNMNNQKFFFKISNENKTILQSNCSSPSSTLSSSSTYNQCTNSLIANSMQSSNNQYIQNIEESHILNNKNDVGHLNKVQNVVAPPYITADVYINEPNDSDQQEQSSTNETHVNNKNRSNKQQSLKNHQNSTSFS
jgi:hypothetical protein